MKFTYKSTVHITHKPTVHHIQTLIQILMEIAKIGIWNALCVSKNACLDIIFNLIN